MQTGTAVRYHYCTSGIVATLKGVTGEEPEKVDCLYVAGMNVKKIYTGHSRKRLGSF